MRNDIHKILVIRLSAMGDVAMTVPVLQSFVDTYPQIKLSVLSQKRFAPFFVSTGLHFIGIDLKYYEGLRGLYSLFKILRKERFDLVLDLHDVLRSNVLRFFFRLVGRKVLVIDKGRRDKRALTRQNNKILRPLRTTVDRYADVFLRAGFELNLLKLDTPVQHFELEEKIAAILPRNNAICIGIAPFAAYKGKIYPPEKMMHVLETLSNKGFHLFLFGGTDSEKNRLQEWESKLPHCLSIIGRFTLREELLLISKLNLMISMDSANMHLASLVGTPVVSIWGATHPYAGFTGWQQSPDNIVQVDMPCRPCSIYGNKQCHRHNHPYACMHEIEPASIVEKIMTILDL
ncbi:MAG: glycosyltransferase family 9 protein [Prevotellaceae bacterium]|jgi:ADP-heptose:LPS heptosyltransferase|nr:glycosyltransferase family 9 protein [Prevotellaceae bacterium]